MGPHRAREPAGNTAPGGLCDPRSASFTEVPGWGPRDLCTPCGDPLPCPLSSAQGLTLSVSLSGCSSRDSEGPILHSVDSIPIVLQGQGVCRPSPLPGGDANPRDPSGAKMKSALRELYSRALVGFSGVSRASPPISQAPEELGRRPRRMGPGGRGLHPPGQPPHWALECEPSGYPFSITPTRNFPTFHVLSHS